MKTIVACGVVAVLVTGCATPDAALEQANHTAALVGQLETGLQDFHRIQARSARERLRIIHRMEAAAEENGSQRRLDEMAAVTTGDTAATRLERKILAMTNAVARENRTLLAADERRNAELASVMKPRPGTAVASLAAEQALAAMGQELSPAARFAASRAFVTAIKAGVDANRKKIDDAEEAAAKATSAATDAREQAIKTSLR